MDESIRKCRLCGTEKAIDEFYLHNKGKTPTRRKECKECTIEKMRYRRTGICNVKYDEMLVIQGGRCAICKCTLNSSRYTKFAVDHDHRTKKVRGLLCTNCNTAIGLMKDSVERFESAITYLSK